MQICDIGYGANSWQRSQLSSNYGVAITGIFNTLDCMEEQSTTIYNQRYETFRHLDKLRWQMFQILIVIASGTSLILRSTTGDIEWWFYLLLGVALVLISFAMLRIGDGIRMNAKALTKAADAIGDDGMPDVSSEWKSVAHWIAVMVMGLGALFIVVAIRQATACSGG